LVRSLQRYTGLAYLQPLIAAMCQENPEDRPTMAAAAAQFDEILARCSGWGLRLLTVRRKNGFGRLLQAFPRYIAHTVSYLIRRVPAVPLLEGGAGS
jgi:hypothetical protein